MTSRVRRRLEEKNKHTIYLSIGGSILLIVFLVFYGIPLFTKFILFLGNNTVSSNNPSASNSLKYVAPPVLDETFAATNSATIQITGIAAKNQTIKLYLNGSVSGEQTTDDKGKFIFATVHLSAGQNEIKAKVFDGDKESAYSNIVTVAYANKGPNLTINTPSDGQTISGGNNKTLHIFGTTDQNANVTINHAWAIVDANGNFSYDFPLQNGQNDLRIVATDQAGNITTIERKVIYNQ